MVREGEVGVSRAVFRGAVFRGRAVFRVGMSDAGLGGFLGVGESRVFRVGRLSYRRYCHLAAGLWTVRVLSCREFCISFDELLWDVSSPPHTHTQYHPRTMHWLSHVTASKDS